MKLSGLLYSLGAYIANDSNPLISIVISCYSLGRLSDIRELLVALQKQAYPNIEILVVVEASTELLVELKAYAKSNGFKNVRFFFSEKTLGLSGARNIGITNAKGDFVAIIDDDALPTECWLEAAVESLKIDDSIIGATGPVIPLWKDTPLDWLPQELGWIIGSSTWLKSNSICDVRHAWGMNMIFKREAFETCGCLSENHGLKKGEEEGIDRFPHEDVEFSLRLKKATHKRIIYSPGAKVFHKVYSRKMCLKYFIKHAYVQGFAKRMVNDLCKEINHSDEQASLSREYDVLKDILVSLIPRTVAGIPKKPAANLQVLMTVTVVLSFLAIGYCSPFYYSIKVKTATSR